MKLAAILLLIGIAMLGHASSLAPYKDEALFMEQYMALSSGQSAEYLKLRDAMLTPKYQLQDYGGTLVAAAAGLFLLFRRGWRNLKSPESRATLLGLALAASCLTVGGYVFDLFLGLERGEFPHWADSMGIPLMEAPVLLVGLLAWSGAHLALVRGTYQSTRLWQAASWNANWWLLLIAALTALLVAVCAAFGQYWYAVSGVAWLYFYLSLAAASRAMPGAEPAEARRLRRASELAP